jgi:hypothetical protein
MDSKNTLLWGVGLLVLGLLTVAICPYCRAHFFGLVAGLFTLAVLAAGLLCLVMGYIAAKEDRDNEAREKAESAGQENMAAQA